MGRLPRACPDHRLEAKRLVDREKHKSNYDNGGPAAKPQCCVDSGQTQCPQHKLWADYRRKSRPLPMRPADDETVQILTGLILAGHGYTVYGG
jgi:hypothetical protein